VGDVFIFFIAFTLLVLGFIGAILPIIPGPILSYLGLLLLHLFTELNFSNTELVLYAIITTIVFLSDYILQFIGVKKFGGGNYSIYGTIIGVIAGLFFPPIGLIIGPFIGAFTGALMDNKKNNEAMVIAFGALVGFVFGTFIKIVYSIAIIYIVIDKLVTLS
jgi:hypothetical protein